MIDRIAYSPYGEATRTLRSDVNGDGFVNQSDYSGVIRPRNGAAIGTAAYIVEADLAQAGIAHEVAGKGVVDFHALRKTYSTLLAAAQVPQRIRQAAMRHADPRLTETTYMDEEVLPVFEHVSALPPLGQATVGS